MALDTDELRVADEGTTMLERVESLRTMYRTNAELARDERRVPAENIEALQKAGFFLALQPARWGWSSGCDYCVWALLGGILPDGSYRTFLVPHRDYRIQDTLALDGTSGHRIQ